MSAKFKLCLIVIFSIFATAATGVYILLRQPSTAVSGMSNGEVYQLASATQGKETQENPERLNYKPIPLESINSALQGSDPADLALNAFNSVESNRIPLKVEVAYPQTNQAMVTITQPKQGNNSISAIKYRVELTTFGRSLLVTSPRMWQIVWAGSQVQCLPGNKLKNASC
ncbi:hypothetical protein G7B40_015710 [Aetokthonos hydrillicola Thurmond2011]|jgi:hypothetical protein|uniref:Uncharacterized protein n=1 Tax=Aetokthonos hydrillicola Thurmond2011 TaxID=2712845 RepID=A0AAP5MAS8_9CYAN|nr:hypothetical protein [Aetokthonos hydrillicola]MBO3464524.1 hypothetical protein [Aetokthonos hydrillicola CCALA 1050]MBW4588668.1 hypothetical protein [Aetokthonos hydrillicola CCALA 1050]MDR9895999.1 hypothetical protein [Aetokthonos hydrillicola Thurmond2011]